MIDPMYRLDSDFEARMLAALSIKGLADGKFNEIKRGAFRRQCY